MKLLRNLLLVLLGIIVLVPTGALYLVASTESGLRFVTARLGKLGSVTVTAEAVSGTLTGGFTVGSLRIQQRRADVRITNAAAQLRLMPLLLERRIDLSYVEVEHVRVETVRDTSGGPGRPPRYLPPTLRVDADRVQAGSVEVVTISGRTLQATKLSAEVTVLSKTIRLRDAQVDWEDMHLAADGRLHAARPTGMDGTVVADWQPEGRPAWRFETELDGDLDHLSFQADLSEPFHAHVEGDATELNAAWKIAGDGTTEDLDISVFGGGNALGILSAQLALTLDRDGFTARGPVTAPGLTPGPIQLDLDGIYDDRRLTLRESTLLHRPSGTRATVHGTVDTDSDGPHLALAGAWSTLQWPLADSELPFTSTAGRYTIEGVRPWKVHAEGDVSAAGHAGLPATLEGTLGSDSLIIDAATLGIYGGTAEVTGEARWNPDESWAVAGHMSGMDPALLRADLPGRVDFDFSASGAPFGDAGTIAFSLANLTGTVRDIAATGSGQFTLPAGSKDWQFQNVDLLWGRTKIQLDGSFGTPRDIRFALDADDLSLLDKDARGRISARGRYAGSDEAPVLLFKARGADFEWQGLHADEFEADVDIDLQGAGHALGKVDLTGVRYGSYAVQQAAIDISGTSTTQRVNLDIIAAPFRAVLTADGTLENEQWRGSIQSMSVTDDSDLALHLESPAPVAVDIGHLELTDLCLAGSQARGCLNGQRTDDGNWNADVAVQDMPLRALTAGLAHDMEYEGTINLRGELAGEAHGLPIGSLRAELMGAQLLHRLDNGQLERLSLGTGIVEAMATPDAFEAHIALDGGTSGDITGSLNGVRKDGSWRQFPIRGQLAAHADALPLLDMYVGGIDKASGQLSTQVDISGTLGAPEWAGQLELVNASIDVYQIGLALRNLTLKARINTDSLDLTGKSDLGGGTANFSGQFTWPDNELIGTLHVGQENGRGLRLVNVPEARIDAAPDLDFELSAGRRIRVTGNVAIPMARLEPADLTNAVLASDDEYLVGEPPVDPEQRWLVTSRITVALGNDVSIDSLGLQAELGGAITVTTDASAVSRGQGELNIRSGKYRAYGRLLDIERGRLIYNNTPLNNPGVELRAQKEFPDVTAGVNVRGQLRAPQVTFFSDAELTQSQIASLIVAGGTLENAQDSDEPGSARNDLLVQGGALIGQRFATRVGIDDFGIESDIDNDTSLVLGKYLSPRLYIGYGISLAEAINTFKMRLTLGKGWTVKTEAGQERSADVVYTFRKGEGEKAEESTAEPETRP